MRDASTETPDSWEGRMSRTIAARAPGAGTIPRPSAPSRRLIDPDGAPCWMRAGSTPASESASS